MLESINDKANTTLNEENKPHKNFIVNGVETDEIDGLDDFEFTNVSNNNENTISETDVSCDTPSDLALTVPEDKKIAAVKNVFLHSLKITWKVIVSTAILTILKILL